MNWQKANQALGNIKRLLQVFETSNNLSAIERDLLLRRIQDLYEIVLDNDNSTIKTASKPVVQTPPVIEKPKVEERVELPKPIKTPKIEIREEIREEKPVVKISQPIEKPKVETPKIEIPKAEPKPKVEILKPPVIKQPTYQESVITNQFDDEETEIIEDLFEFKVATDLSEKLSAGPIRDLTTSMSINERFITISELFKGNKAKYDEAIHELNSFNNFEQAKTYILNHLIGEYKWTNKKKTKLAKAFIKKVWRRYL